MKKRTNGRMVWVVSAALALAMASSRAEDIDLYVSASTASSAPNVLFVIDNTSNWSGNEQAWNRAAVRSKCDTAPLAQREACRGYVDQVFGTDSDLTQGQVQAAALKLVLQELVCGSSARFKGKVKIGFMFLNEAGTVDSPSYISGYIRHRVALLDQVQCDRIVEDLTAIRANPQNPTFKGPSSASYGLALFEAFKYFGGWTNKDGAISGTAGSPAGPRGFGPERNSLKTDREDPLAFTDNTKSTYLSPITDTCSDSYLVFVGNTFPNLEPTGTSIRAKGTPTETYLNTLEGIRPQIYPTPLDRPADYNSVRFGDEWTRFLREADVSDVPGRQNLRTFAIDVWNKLTPDRPDQKRLLQSMARAGDPSLKDGDRYFEVNGSLKALIDSFTDILTSVAAENSVFASASLPVSANTQGLYLNQVFIGMFRPDAEGHQRWSGNLKQYQFKQIQRVTPEGQTVNDLTLVDAVGSAALDETTGGFLKTCARSFWTTDSSNYWSFVPGAPSNVCDDTSAWSDLPDGPIVERGGAAQRLRVDGHASRNLRTCNSGCASATVSFDTTNVTSLSSELVRWVRGENANDLGDGFLTDQGVASTVTYPGLPISPTTRPTIHGGVIHSRPLVVNYGTTTDDVVVFYGADDGVLRAVDGNKTGSTAGQELWGFIAPEHYAKFTRLKSNSPKISYPGFAYTPAPRPKDYFFDGSIGGYQEITAGTPKVWLYASMRRGGRMVYAFDASQKPSRTLNPTLLWRFGCASDTECATGADGETQVGQTWSTPQAIRVRVGTATVPLVAFGAGYDACEDQEATTDPCAAGSKGRGLYVLDAERGTARNYRHFLPSNDLSPNGVGRFVADVTSLDINLDGYIDVLYTADTRGNLWRINTSNPSDGYKGYDSVEKWPMVLVASVSDWTTSGKSDRRKFLYGASAVHLKDGQVIVQLGSGDREKPLQGSEAANVVNRFYGIRDNVTKTSQSDVTPVTHSGTGLAGLTNVTGQDPVEPETTVGSGGWYLNLVTTSAPYEQVVTTPLTIGGVTYFSTYQAKGETPEGACYNLGTARAYRVDFQTGTKLPDYPLATEFLRGGFAPSPVAGIALVDGKKVPFIIGGPGASQIGVDKPVLNPKKKRTPVYRYQRIDR